MSFLRTENDKSVLDHTPPGRTHVLHACSIKKSSVSLTYLSNNGLRSGDAV